LNEQSLRFPYAEIASKDGSSVFKLYTYGYQYTNRENGDDADWQRNSILLIIPGFKVEFEKVIFQGTLLEHYANELNKFLLSERNEINVEPTESYFGLKFTYDSLKQIFVKGYIQYPLGWGATLAFEFTTDTALIECFVKGIIDILSHYPPRK
jgi:hypothetical protein